MNSARETKGEGPAESLSRIVGALIGSALIVCALGAWMIHIQH